MSQNIEITSTYVNRRGELMREYKFYSWRRRLRLTGLELTDLDNYSRLKQPSDAVCIDTIMLKQGKIALSSRRIDYLTY